MAEEKTTLIFGAGFSGKAYGQALAKRGLKVFGTTRSSDKSAALEASGMVPLIFDGENLNDDLHAAINQVSDIVISIAPDEAGDPVLIAACNVIENAPHLQWMGYLSTVGVYGNHDGAWVDEMTPCKPVSKRSVQRVAAENQWLDFAQALDLPLAVLRLSGIYGPGRNGLKNIIEGTARRLIKPGQVFNRIHVADIAGSLDLLSDKREGGIYNVTDDMPCPPQDVVEYAALVAGVTPPEPIDFETADLSPMARSFYGENKRVSNGKIKQAGYSFQYPDYRIAFDKMWATKSWR